MWQKIESGDKSVALVLPIYKEVENDEQGPCGAAAKHHYASCSQVLFYAGGLNLLISYLEKQNKQTKRFNVFPSHLCEVYIMHFICYCICTVVNGHIPPIYFQTKDSNNIFLLHGLVGSSQNKQAQYSQQTAAIAQRKTNHVIKQLAI